MEKNLRVKQGLLAAALTLGIAGVAAAGPTSINPIGGGDGSEPSLQEILNGIGATGVNVNTDQFQPDAFWRLNASGGSHTQVVIEVSAHDSTNAFGIYNPADLSERFALFDGSSDTGDRLTFGFDADSANNIIDVYKTDGTGTHTGTWTGGSVFGFYLEDGTSGNVFFSNPFSNGNGVDQMVAFQGNGQMIDLPSTVPGLFGVNDFVFAWEDLPLGSSDHDYNDFVVFAESLSAVPGPSALGMFGIGLLMLGGALRWRSKSK